MQCSQALKAEAASQCSVVLPDGGLTAGRWAEPVGGVMYTDPPPVRGVLSSPGRATPLPLGVCPKPSAWLAAPPGAAC